MARVSTELMRVAGGSKTEGLLEGARFRVTAGRPLRSLEACLSHGRSQHWIDPTQWDVLWCSGGAPSAKLGSSGRLSGQRARERERPAWGVPSTPPGASPAVAPAAAPHNASSSGVRDTHGYGVLGGVWVYACSVDEIRSFG